MNRAQAADTTPPDVAAVAALNRAGWSVGDIGIIDADGWPRWIV